MVLSPVILLAYIPFSIEKLLSWVEWERIWRPTREKESKRQKQRESE